MVKRYRKCKHGVIFTNFYGVWHGIKMRCLNSSIPNYENYGGRGIKVCDRWLKFENFRDDMYQLYLEHRKNNSYTSIERINNDGNYELNNCYWATMKEQQNNTRKNRLITYKKQTMNVNQWAKKLNVSSATLFTRLNRNWSVEKTIITPIIYHSYYHS